MKVNPENFLFYIKKPLFFITEVLDIVITYDTSVSMGYIYLQPSRRYLNFLKENKDDLISYVGNHKCKISFLTDEFILEKLQQLKRSTKIYSHALYDGELNQEYQNDLDQDGYLIGIELSLHPERFSTLLQHAFRCYSLIWNERPMHLYTFEEDDLVFYSRNILYPLHWDRDSYIIVYRDPKNQIGYIRGLLTANEERYPSSYLLQPLFYVK